MLNADDLYTPASLSRLKAIVRQGRPVVLWVGAGASRWAGLPSWHESAVRMRKAFANNVMGFADGVARAHIDSKAYPALFELCKEADPKLYHGLLLKQFDSPEPSIIYQQFIRSLKTIFPLQIVTTNIDLCLEQSSLASDVIERSDVERITESLLKRAPFVAKLHGSISSISSAVFATSDYEKLSKSDKYLQTLRTMFSVSSVIFLGYGIQDEYVLKLLETNVSNHDLFGSGPHFKVTSDTGPPQEGVYRIGYKIMQHPDHRAALTVMNVIAQASNPQATHVGLGEEKCEAGKSSESAFYISSFVPSGTHVTGQFLTLDMLGGDARINAYVGLGFAQGEVPSSSPIAFHDLAVGLICFDRVYLPLTAIGLLHERATSEVFWALISSGAVKFVDVVHAPFFGSTPDDVLGSIAIYNDQQPGSDPRTAMDLVRKFIKPFPGNEIEGNQRIEGLESKIISFHDSAEFDLPGLVRDGLLLPRVSQLLGYSDYIETNRIPRWLAYPTLRFAHLVQTGLICGRLGFRASRVPFGGTSLLSAAFGVNSSEQSAFEYAGFVVNGAFGSNMSEYFERRPSRLLDLLKFRESLEGQDLRREISDRLETNDGTEFSSSVEGSLKRAIPNAVLQAARNKYSTLMKAANPDASAEVVWADSNTDDASLRLWRTRSQELLLSEVTRVGVRASDPCLCGSGDRLRDCCMRPLKQ